MENRIAPEKNHDGMGCSAVQSRMRQMMELEQAGREEGVLLLSGVVECPFGQRCARVIAGGVPIEVSRCRAEVSLPRFTNDDYNEKARQLWPNVPHRSLTN